MFGIPQPLQSIFFQSGCIGNYITTKNGYQIVNRKSGEVVMEGVSIGKMYALKQSIPNILYKNITKDIEQEKAFMAKVSL
jgi:hypothetical protein